MCIVIVILRLLNLGDFGERKLNLGDSRMEILLKAQVTDAFFCLISYLKSINILMNLTSLTAVWECESWERHTIIKRIADYVLMKHLALQKDDLIHIVDQLDFCLLVDGQGKFQIFLCCCFTVTMSLVLGLIGIMQIRSHLLELCLKLLILYLSSYVSWMMSRLKYLPCNP